MMIGKGKRMLHCEAHDVWEIVDAWPMDPRGDYYIIRMDGSMAYCETLAKVKEIFGRVWEFVRPEKTAAMIRVEL